jgi:hypothetical protein
MEEWFVGKACARVLARRARRGVRGFYASWFRNYSAAAQRHKDYRGGRCVGSRAAVSASGRSERRCHKQSGIARRAVRPTSKSHMGGSLKEYRMLSTSGILGYGYAEVAEIGMSWGHMSSVAMAAAPTRPYYLGAGKSFCSRLSVKRDLRLMLQAATAAGIPASSAPLAALAANLICRIPRRWFARSRANKLTFKMALIHAEQSRAIEGLGRWRPHRAARQDGTAQRRNHRPIGRVVAMMGPEPIAKALDGGAQVILAGRSG